MKKRSLNNKYISYIKKIIIYSLIFLVIFRIIESVENKNNLNIEIKQTKKIEQENYSIYEIMRQTIVWVLFTMSFLLIIFYTSLSFARYINKKSKKK